MKEAINKEVTEKKVIRHKRMWYLLADGKEFIYAEGDGLPNIKRAGEVLSFHERRHALYASTFFKRMGIANDIALVAAV